MLEERGVEVRRGGAQSACGEAWGIYSFPGAAITKYNKRGGLKQEEYVLS